MFACSSGGGVGPGASQPLPCDVDAVLAASCRSCHGTTPQFGAPMSLVTYADLQAPAVTDKTKKVYQLVEARIHDDAHPMPQQPNPRLSAADTATIDAWVNAGAQAGGSGQMCSSPADGGADSPSGDGGGACNPNTHLAPASAWTMPTADNDDYVCYAIDTPKDTSYAVRLSPRIDNTKIVHHLLLFNAPNGSKYTSTPTKCSSAFGGAGWSIVYGWAPGGNTLDLPPEASLTLDPSTHYVVQVHYNNINHLVGETDTSGFDLCTQPTPRANQADVVAFGSFSFSIPPHATTDITCNNTIDSALAGINIIATWGHMHKIGTAITSTLTPIAGGAPNPFIDVPMFDFNGQQWVPKSGTFQTGDTVKTRCVWNNTSDVTVNFGENTEDEMCFGFVMYYPKKNLLTWALPAMNAQCGPTP